MTEHFVPVNESDYLEQDNPIRGQKYCCLSFISPEDVIKNKEVYFVEKFLKSYSNEMQTLFDNMLEMFANKKEIIDSLNGIHERYAFVFDTEKVQEEFTYYKAAHGDKLEDEYLELNKFQTTIRGLKVRGSYETLKEAEIRAQVLKRMDDKFNVFVAEVGCWCPWSPNPEELQNQEYAETHLNTLVKKYHDNQQKKDEFFLERKDKLKQMALEDNEKNNSKFKVTQIVEEPEEEEQVKPVQVVTEEQVQPLEPEQEVTNETIQSVVTEEKTSIVTDNVEQNTTIVTEDIPSVVIDGIEQDDPWLQRVNEKLLAPTGMTSVSRQDTTNYNDE